VVMLVASRALVLLESRQLPDESIDRRLVHWI
jgi:hypothetical protein